MAKSAETALCVMKRCDVALVAFIDGGVIIIGVVVDGSCSSGEIVVVNVSNCRYEVVRSAAKSAGWRVEEDEDEYDALVADATAGTAAAAPATRTAHQQAVILRHHHAYARARTREPWNVYWTDTSVSSQRAMRLERFQRLNHFPGMYHLARKGGLGKHLTQLAKLFPSDFSFFPQTWVLPQQWSEFKERIESGKGNRTFIIKPDASCQGKGIFLTRTHENVNPTESQVAQRYLHKPLLIDGFKFDMRIYVILTSVDPLRIFLFEDGLVRICTQKYVEPRGRNLQKSRMHLTNYAINKESEDFVFNEATSDPGTGNKRSLRWFWGWLEEQHGKDARDGFVAETHDMIIKSIISVLPQLRHIYRSCVKHPGPSNCFEILGFDVLMDRKFKPWLIEVNHSPSFACDTPLDTDIKSRLIAKTMALIGVHASDKRKSRQRLKKDAQSRLYGATAPKSRRRLQYDGASTES
ncbi:Tubulin polyglutamylase ttll6 [Hondaea fermentalgiana]|uniref:Tubulin polyglutamylase ttll6 n=1 Tax=Hondaea fermentalgiana TaxID=2315210 RepID=A0A2R5G326_9STRA|nr:Tubulin polyglutamylase ttll6 [Hondaea fermentalgiana]|eukprot:GBG24138.1 Tubulin polyglutamylase ttll6 [Hondaea fermentalgiana]